MKKIIEYNNLKEIRKENKDKKIVLCSGCFDILHSGHAVFFEQCKEHGDILVVALGTDENIKRQKGEERPVNCEMNRAFLLSSLKNVDYVILTKEKMRPGKIDFYEVLKDLNPDVFVLNDDDSAIKEKSEILSSFGVELKLVKRVAPDYLKAVSSTEIVNKIRKAIIEG
jgi:rfaE bifunctional protein nucleotidyltransferase chain/domain